MIATNCEPGPSQRKLRVLVAEDETLMRVMLADELREQGFQAADAHEALSILQTIAVDVIVTDVHMHTTGDGFVLADYVPTSPHESNSLA